MAAQLTKLGRIRKIVEKRNDGWIKFRTSEDHHRVEDGWVCEVWDAFIFRNYYSKHDLIRSDLFQIIFGDSKVALDRRSEAFSVFMNGGFEEFVDYVLNVYHANFGEDYL